MPNRIAARSDGALLARARSGDLDAFALFVERYESRVRTVLSRLLDDERDVEETTQDTFVQAWRHLDSFRGEAALFTWLYRIAVNEALMRLRRHRPPLLELDELSERQLASSNTRGEPEAAAQAEEFRSFLLACLRDLPVEYRVPLVLRDLEGLSNRDVAETLGLSLAAAKSRVHRARLEIRERLAAWEAEREPAT